jgi:hypothetical protein
LILKELLEGLAHLARAFRAFSPAHHAWQNAPFVRLSKNQRPVILGAAKNLGTVAWSLPGTSTSHFSERNFSMSTEPTASSDLVTANQCQHLSPRGQHCRMLRVDDEALCPYHLRLTQASRPDPEILAAELLESTGNLNTADRVNALLANVVKQFARQRIDRRDALAIGYLAQLLLNTVPGVQKEYQAIRAAEAREALRKSIAESAARRTAGQSTLSPL